jgi:hypothetical protein
VRESVQKNRKNVRTLGLLVGLSVITIAAALIAPAGAQSPTPPQGATAAPAAGSKPQGSKPQTATAASEAAPKPQSTTRISGPKPQSASATTGTAGSAVKREPIKQPVTSAGCKNALSPGKPYFVEFRSRTAASYGHTFVFYGQLGSGNRFANFKVAGLHPKGDDPSTYIQGHWMPVEAETGVSYGDLDEQYMTARFCVTLTQAEYTKLSAYIRNLQATTKKWHAGTYNCNSFAADIAKAAGLDSPNPNAYLPDVFIKRLAESNSKKSASSSSFSFPNFSSMQQGSEKPRR